MTMSANEIRRSFLQYFERHQHKVVTDIIAQYDREQAAKAARVEPIR